MAKRVHQKQAFGLAVCNSVSVPACLSFITLDPNKDSPTISALFSLLKHVWQ